MMMMKTGRGRRGRDAPGLVEAEDTHPCPAEHSVSLALKHLRLTPLPALVLVPLALCGRAPCLRAQPSTLEPRHAQRQSPCSCRPKLRPRPFAAWWRGAPPLFPSAAKPSQASGRWSMAGAGGGEEEALNTNTLGRAARVRRVSQGCFLAPSEAGSADGRTGEWGSGREQESVFEDEPECLLFHPQPPLVLTSPSLTRHPLPGSSLLSFWRRFSLPPSSSPSPSS